MRQACCAEIRLSALRHNAQVVRQKVPHAKIAAVVKADAYGHGIKTVAAALEDHVDLFAVAYLEEALVLRSSSPHPILVLEGFFDQQELDVAAKQGFACVIHSAYQLTLLKKSPLAHTMNLWLKVDTGMNRLGFSQGEFESAYSQLSENADSQALILMSHLSSADELDSKVSTKQISAFSDMVSGKQKAVSLANSAGIMAWPEATTDQFQQWVRPGIMLYGCSPFAHSTGPQVGLQAAMTLRSTIIGLREISAGDRIGYGATWQAKRPSRIGVVAIGYGDGYPRH
ncbi:MAG: alanine racemase, partial [Pseudomonadales bacterium]|nr:alanine racemase [Pseudomonadales bacterium]